VCCNADRTTFVGSMMPGLTMSLNSAVGGLSPPSARGNDDNRGYDQTWNYDGGAKYSLSELRWTLLKRPEKYATGNVPSGSQYHVI
jgi:hypothetical protein